MSTTVGAPADTARQHTPGGTFTKALVLLLLVVPLVGRLAALEQLPRLEVTGGLTGLEPLGERVVLTRSQVLGQLVVVDAAHRGLVAAVGHAHGYPPAPLLAGVTTSQTSGRRFWLRG